MSALPWTLLGLPEGFSCTNLELRFARPGELKRLVHDAVTRPETVNYRANRAGCSTRRSSASSTAPARP